MHLLVLNCHEAWVHQLESLGADLDILVGLPGHHHEGWDARMRPQPRGSRLVSLPDVLEHAGRVVYDGIVCHSLTDLMDCRLLAGPRLLVVHSTYEGRVAEEQAGVPPALLRAKVRHYLKLVGGHAVAVSEMKRGPEGFPEQVVTAAVDVAAYPPHRGEVAAGLRIANQITRKRLVLDWDFHEAAFAGLPVALVGHNPDRPGVFPARDWDGLKETLAAHRFYIHTADPRYEDGFNMALLEAMAAGLPVLGNRHPSSPVEDGVEGFLSDDPAELRARAEQLLADPALAARMGAAAREKVAGRFPIARFVAGMREALAAARANWEALQPTPEKPSRAA